MAKEQNPDRINRINSFVNGLFLKAQISTIGQEQLQKIREKEQLSFIKEKFYISDDEQAKEKLKSVTELTREFSKEDQERHAWHKTSSAGYRLADAVEKSFGEDAKINPQLSEHHIPTAFIKDWIASQDGPKPLPHKIKDDASYAVEVTHVPANGETKSPRRDRVALKATELSGQSWECALDTSYGKISYANNTVGHKLLFTNSSRREGEIVVKDAKLEDIQAFAELLKEATTLPI